MVPKHAAAVFPGHITDEAFLRDFVERAGLAPEYYDMIKEAVVTAEGLRRMAGIGKAQVESAVAALFPTMTPLDKVLFAQALLRLQIAL